MDPELLNYLSGGFFAGTPDAVAARVHPTPSTAARDPGQGPVVGLWLHPEDADLLLEEELPMAPARRPPVQQQLQRGLTVREIGQGGAEILGFQVIGFEDDRAWTWAEAGLVDTVAAEIDVECGRDGLLADRQSAVSAAQLLNHEDLGPPVIWRPWLLSAHRPPGGV